MARKIPPPLSLALDLLRTARVWSQKELAEATGIPANLISDYEAGRKPLHRDRLDLMVKAMGLRPGAVDSALQFLQEVRAGSREPVPPSPQSRRIEAVAAESGRMMAGFTRSLLTLLTTEASALEARQQAEALWTRFKRYDATQRRALIEKTADFQNWAFCERLCEESINAAGDSADRALELANLALRVAELSPGEDTWLQRLQGYAWAHVGNARRVRSDLPGAEEAFGRAQKLWNAGSTGDSGLLDEVRLLDLEASLRRAQTHFTEALALLNDALSKDKGALRDRLLLNKATVLEALGDLEGAVSVLYQAAPEIHAKGEPRFIYALRFNLAVNLCCLGQYETAFASLPELRGHALSLGNSLDIARLRWLEGRIFAGLGKSTEAIRNLSQVREEFSAHGLAQDIALVSLELAVLYLELGRTAEVRTLARHMSPIFRTQGVHREVLAALKLFRDAAETESVTLELARKLVAYLYRAQHNPQLRFDSAV